MPAADKQSPSPRRDTSGPHRELKEQAWEANIELAKHDLVVFTFGNVSAADHSRGVFAIKPSGVPYSRLRPADMVVVDFDGATVNGKLRPSSDTRTHAVLYRHFPEMGGIAHTHSPYAVAWAQAMRPIPILGTTHADHLTADVPCTEVMHDSAIGGDYELETGNQIVRALKGLSCQDFEMILVACHGPFTWGTSAAKALHNSVVLEELAKMAYLTLSINPQTPRLKRALINKHYQRKHGRAAYYGQR